MIAAACKETAKDTSSDENVTTIMGSETLDSHFVVDHVDMKFVEKEVKDIPREKLLYWYKTALELDFERPYMWDVFIPENVDLPEFYHYRTFKLNEREFNSVYISIKYEHADYEAVLLLMDENDVTGENKALLIYENLDSEEKYKRTTRHGENNEFLVEFIKNGDLYKKQFFIIKNNSVANYFNADKTVDENWGMMEDVSANNLKGKTKAYLMKGTVKNNLKNGHWEERRYSFEYDSNIWMDGNYIEGLKDGEWNLSPNGIVDKVVIYEKGKILKSYKTDAQEQKTYSPKKDSQKLSSINFFDKKYASDYTMIVDESTLADHPIQTYLNCEESYFTIHYIPKTQELNRYWNVSYFQNLNLENIDLENESKVIEEKIKSEFKDYAVFCYYVPAKYIASGTCAHESVFLANNTLAKIFYFNKKSRNWQLLKQEESASLPRIIESEYFTGNFRFLFN